MATGSFIEMFMTVFGWVLYDIVWDVIVGTGLVYLPIIAAIIDNVISPIESQEAKSAAVTSLRRLEVDILRIMVFLFLVAVPMQKLEFTAVSYSVSNNCNNIKVSGGSTNTTMEGVLQPTKVNGKDAVVPIWWYLVLSVSGGINDAILSQLPCDIKDVRQLKYEMSTVQIKSTSLQREAQIFEKECYRVARADYLNSNLTASTNDDISWFGSEFFVNNTYKRLYAKEPVAGFTHDPAKRASDASHPASEGARPACDEWWEKIRKGVLAENDVDWIDNYIGLGIFSSRETLEKEAVREALTKTGGGLNLAAGTDLNATSFSETDMASWTTELIGTGLAVIGGALLEAVLQPTLFFIIKLLPYLQATMLMGIYFLLPWALLIGNYEWSTIKTATVTIFAIKFWSVIWAVVHILDMQLLTTIDNNGKYGVGSLDFAFIEVVIDMVILSLYLGLPFFFMSMLAWAGEKGASASNNASDGMGKGAGSAGSAGAGAVKK